MKSRLIALVCAFGAASCATPAVSVSTTLKALDEKASSYHAISVLGFEGQFGEEFTSALTAKLKNISVDGQPYFSIFDNATLRANAGISDPSQITKNVRKALNPAKKLGIQGIYYGTMPTRQVTRNAFQGEAQACLRLNANGTCAAYTPTAVGCIKVEATYRVVIQLVDTASGATVYTRDYGDSQSQNQCDAIQSQAVLSDGALLGAAQTNVLNKIAKDVAPYSQIQTVSLMSDDATVPADLRPRFKSAVDFAAAGRFDRACPELKAMASQASASVAILYNQGVCAEVDGNYVGAERLYVEADRNTTAPNQMIGSAIARVRNLQHTAQ